MPSFQRLVIRGISSSPVGITLLKGATAVVETSRGVRTDKRRGVSVRLQGPDGIPRSATVMSSRYYTLMNVLGGYFHQDWKLEAASPEAVIQHILEDVPHETIAEAASELRGLLRETMDENALEAFMMNPLGVCYDPGADGKSMRQWLEEVLEQLETA